MPVVYAQVLATSAVERVPAIMLTIDGHRYIFNVCEGTQRFCMEHHLKVVKVNCIFLSGLCATYSGGLPGMLMTMSDAGNLSANICGPPGSGRFLMSTKPFFRRSNLDVSVHECFPSKNKFAVYCDAVLTVTCVVLKKQKSNVCNNNEKEPMPGVEANFAEKRKREDLRHTDSTSSKHTGDSSSIESGESPSNYLSSKIVSNDSNGIIRNKRRRLSKFVGDKDDVSVATRGSFGTRPYPRTDQFKSLAIKPLGQSQHANISAYAGEIVCYICKTKPIRGKFYPEIAISKGVPKGKLFGKLSCGEDIVLENGVKVLSKDCKAPDRPGALFAIVSCPNVEYVDDLVCAREFQLYRKRATGSTEIEERLSCIFHFCPSQIFHSLKYRTWREGFGKGVQHVLANETFCQNFPEPMQASRRQRHLLNYLHKRIFPLQTHNTMITEPQKNVDFFPTPSLSKITFIPATKFGFDFNACVDDTESQKDAETLIADALKTTELEKHIERLRLEEKKFLSSDKPIENSPIITFLGTGSAQPSKYRNVSSIHVSTSCGNYLLDCGEGTYGQMSKFFGHSQLQNEINKIKFVFISHMHADHHIGLGSIIRARELSSPSEKLLVVGPFALSQWLKACADFEYDDEGSDSLCNFENKYEFIDIEYGAKNYGWGFPPWSVYENTPEIKEAGRRGLINKLNVLLGIESFESVRVKHCFASYGVVIDQKLSKTNSESRTYRLVYSGDARPSDELAEYGADADILIHEATFEDGLVSEAKNRYHSTVSEALGVSKRMRAQHTILTHFSQRYPKIATIASAESKLGMETECNIGVESSFEIPKYSLAFDMMSVTLNDMNWLPSILPALQCIFPSGE
eukprot:g6382.t1